MNKIKIDNIKIFLITISLLVLGLGWIIISNLRVDNKKTEIDKCVFFKGEWYRTDSIVSIIYLPHPTNSFQVTKSRKIFNIGQYKITDIVLTDSINNIYTVKNLHQSNTNEYFYQDEHIRILNDSSFMIYDNESSTIYNRKK